MLTFIMLARLSVLCPSAVLQRLERLIEPLRATCSTKVRAAPGGSCLCSAPSPSVLLRHPLPQLENTLLVFAAVLVLCLYGLF